jgi:hypothetical protein
MARNNQDAYRRGGRNGNGAAYRKQSNGKGQAGRVERTRKSPPQAQHTPMTASEEAEAQLASLHGEKSSVLDRLPKAVGPAGVPRSARPTPTAEQPTGKWQGTRQAFEEGAFAREPREEEAPFGFGMPASASAQRSSVPVRRLPPPEPRLSRVQERLVRAFPPLFRAIGDAAQAVERPVRNALDTLQWLGRAARRAS